MKFDVFWEHVQSTAYVIPEDADQQERRLKVLDDVCYSSAAKMKDILPTLDSVTVNELKQMFEDLHHFECMEGEGNEFELHNSDQELMELNRSPAVCKAVRNLVPEKSKRRLL